MKKSSLLSLLFLTASLLAQETNDAIFNLENSPPPIFPFSVSGSALSVNKTHFRTPGFEDDTLVYKQYEAAFAYTHPINSVCGLIFGAGWVGSEVNMVKNPEFDETRFDYVTLSLGGFTKAFPDWSWTFSLSAFLDTEVFSLIDYTLYQGVLWGKYELSPYLELDFGFIAEIGLSKEKLWPILGFIYSPSDSWRIHAVYPIRVSVDYLVRNWITLSGSIRFLRNRHRVTKEEPNPSGIFEYHTIGAEFDVTLSPLKRLSLKGFAGTTFNGDLKITDSQNRAAQHFKFKGSPYVGVSGVFSY